MTTRNGAIRALGVLAILAALRPGGTWARPVSLDSSLEPARRHAREAPGGNVEGRPLASAWAAFLAFVSGGRAASTSTSSSATTARAGDGATCACSMCVRITLRAVALSPQQQQLGGSGSGGARLDAGSCDRVQQLLASDLTQAAAHLGIHVTQPFAPAACQLEQDLPAAAEAAEQGAAQAGGGGGSASRVVSTVSVCGRVQEGPAATSALTLHLQEAAARYYAAAELAEQDLYSCPPAMAGMSVSVDLIRREVPLAEGAEAAVEGPGAAQHTQQRAVLAAAAEADGECVTTVHELSCMRRKTRK